MLGSIIICMATAYFLGSLNFGIIISERFYHEDVRDKGSGNAGSTNMLRSFGKKAAVLTLVGDAFKTAVSCSAGFLIYGIPGMYISGLFCMLGHMFPCYYKFKGGKGIVCLAVMVAMTDWRVFLILFAVFLILVIGTRYVSLGSVIVSMLYPVVLNRMNNTGLLSIELVAVAVAALVVYKHWGNIKRLREGTESKLSFKKKTAQSVQKSGDSQSAGSEGSEDAGSENDRDGDEKRILEGPDKNTSRKKMKKKK